MVTVSTPLRRVVAPTIALVLALGAAFAGPSSSAERPTDPGRDIDGPGYQLKPADAAELAEALGVEAPTAQAARTRMAAASERVVAASPSTGPDFEMPFTCGSSWTGSSRSSHSPSAYAIDFNTPDDFRKPVLASAPGTVTLVRSLTYSYGKYVVIDHGGGYSTLYAHLDSLAATVGQRVDQGDLIGLLGTTGGSTGPHLHFEQRRNGSYFPPYFHRATWRFGSTAASASCGDRPLVGDWNGDGVDEPAVFRPRLTGSYVRTQRGTSAGDIRWGAAGDTPVAADFDGDEVAQVGVKGLGSSTWKLRSASGATATVAGVGGTADVPVVGDWDRNGRAELGWYRWSDRTFSLRWPDGSVRTTVFGGTGQTPVVGDWDGNRVAEVGTFEPTTATWRLKVGTTTRTLVFGQAGDLPLVGDFDGDGTDDVGTWRPSRGLCTMKHSSTGRTVTTYFGARRG